MSEEYTVIYLDGSNGLPKVECPICRSYSYSIKTDSNQRPYIPWVAVPVPLKEKAKIESFLREESLKILDKIRENLIQEGFSGTENINFESLNRLFHISYLEEYYYPYIDEILEKIYQQLSIKNYLGKKYSPNESIYLKYTFCIYHQSKLNSIWIKNFQNINLKNPYDWNKLKDINIWNQTLLSEFWKNFDNLKTEKSLAYFEIPPSPNGNSKSLPLPEAIFNNFIWIKTYLSFEKLLLQKVLNNEKRIEIDIRNNFISSLTLENYNFSEEEVINMDNNIFETLIIKEISNKGFLKIRNTVIDSTLEINKSILGKTYFINCDFSKAKEINILDSDLTETKFLGVNWGEISEGRICPKLFEEEPLKAREVYRQLKYAHEEIKDYYHADQFFALEMKALERYLYKNFLKKTKTFNGFNCSNYP